MEIIGEGQYFSLRKKSLIAECQTKGGGIVWLDACCVPNFVLSALMLLKYQSKPVITRGTEDLWEMRKVTWIEREGWNSTQTGWLNNFFDYAILIREQLLYSVLYNNFPEGYEDLDLERWCLNG